MFLQPRGALAQVQADAGVATTAVAQQLPVLNAAMRPVSDYFARTHRLNERERAANLDAGRAADFDLTRAVLPATSPLMTRLLEQLAQINTALRQTNGGRDVFPITGTTPQERFNSFMSWLRSNPNITPGEPQLGSEFDEAAFTRFQRLAPVAVNTPARDAQMNAALAQLGTVPPTGADAGTAVPSTVPTVPPTPGPLGVTPVRMPPVPVPVVRPGAPPVVAAGQPTTTTVPAPTPAVAVQPTGPTVVPAAPVRAPPPLVVTAQTLRQENLSVIDNLNSIINAPAASRGHPGPTAAQISRARTLLAGINQRLSRYQRDYRNRSIPQAQQTAFDRYINETVRRDFLNRPNSQGETPLTLAATSQANSVARGLTTTIIPHLSDAQRARLGALMTDLGQQLVSQETRTTLGYLGSASVGVQNQVFQLLEDARVAHAAGNDRLAATHVQTAVTRFEAEQAAIRLYTRSVLIPTLEAMVTQASSSTSRYPTVRQLGELGADIGPFRRVPRGARRTAQRPVLVDIGRDGIANYYGRLRSLLADYTSTTSGILYFPLIRDMYRRVNAASGSFDNLSGAWELATANGATPSREFADAFAQASRALVVASDLAHYSGSAYDDLRVDFTSWYVRNIWDPDHPGYRHRVNRDGHQDDLHDERIQSSMNDFLAQNPDILYQDRFTSLYRSLADSMQNRSGALATAHSLRVNNTALYQRWAQDSMTRDQVFRFFNPRIRPPVTDSTTRITNSSPLALRMLRFHMARQMLEDSIRVANETPVRESTGPNDPTNPLRSTLTEALRIARAALRDAHPPTDATQIPQVSDELFQLSRYLAATSEALILRTNAATAGNAWGQWRPSAEAAAAADLEIREGTISFHHDFAFSGAVPPARHLNLPGNFLESAIQALSPPVFTTNEQYAMRYDIEVAAYSNTYARGNAPEGSDPVRTLAPLQGEENTTALARLARGEFTSADQSAHRRLLEVQTDAEGRNIALLTLFEQNGHYTSPLISQYLTLASLAGPSAAIDPRFNRFDSFNDVESTGSFVRPTQTAIDRHTVILEDSLRFYDRIAIGPAGAIPVELNRLLLLHQNTEDTEILRALDVRPDQAPGTFGVGLRAVAARLNLPTDRSFLASMQEAALRLRDRYGMPVTVPGDATHPPTTRPPTPTDRALMVAEAYELVRGVLDADLARLAYRLSEPITIGGRTITVHELAVHSDQVARDDARLNQHLDGSNTNPRGQAVTNAIEILRDLESQSAALGVRIATMRTTAQSDPARVLNSNVSFGLHAVRELIAESEDASQWAVTPDLTMGGAPAVVSNEPSFLSHFGLAFAGVRASVDEELTAQARRTMVRADYMVRNRAGVEMTLAAFIDSYPAGAQREEVRRYLADNCTFNWVWFEGRGTDLHLVGMNGRRVAQMRPSSEGGVEFYAPDGTVLMHARTPAANTINPVFDETLNTNLSRVAITTRGSVPFSVIALPPGVDLIDVLPTVFPSRMGEAGVSTDAGAGGTGTTTSGADGGR